MHCGCCCSATCYPKLQLAQVGDSFFALNQSCLDIYRRLQRHAAPSAAPAPQLMHVDVVPLSKLPQNVQKSLMALSRETADDAGVGGVFDVMSAASGGGSSQCCQFLSTSLISASELSVLHKKDDWQNGGCTKSFPKEAASWWSRWFFAGKNSQSGTTNNRQEPRDTVTRDSGTEFCCLVCSAPFSDFKQTHQTKDRSRRLRCNTCCKTYWSEVEEDLNFAASDSEGYFLTDDENYEDTSSEED